MTLLWTLISLLALTALLAIIGVLLYQMFGSLVDLRKARSQAQRYRSARQWILHDLDHAEVKRRLVNHKYFSAPLRATPTLKNFLIRLDKGEEVWLASRYQGRKLYRLLAKAEREAGLNGPSEAPAHVDEISELLRELARKSQDAAG